MPRVPDRQPNLRLPEKAIATKYRARQFFVAASAAIAVTAGFLLAAQPAAAAGQPGLRGGASLRLSEIQPGGHPALHIATPVNIDADHPDDLSSVATPGWDEPGTGGTNPHRAHRPGDPTLTWVSLSAGQSLGAAARRTAAAGRSVE